MNTTEHVLRELAREPQAHMRAVVVMRGMERRVNVPVKLVTIKRILRSLAAQGLVDSIDEPLRRYPSSNGRPTRERVWTITDLGLAHVYSGG